MERLALRADRLMSALKFSISVLLPCDAGVVPATRCSAILEKIGVRKQELVWGMRDQTSKVNELLGLYNFLKDNLDIWKDRTVVLEKSLGSLFPHATHPLWTRVLQAFASGKITEEMLKKPAAATSS